MLYLENVKLDIEDRIILTLLVFFLTPLLGGGIYYLLSTNGKNKEDKLAKLKKYLALQFVVLGGALALFSVILLVFIFFIFLIWAIFSIVLLAFGPVGTFIVDITVLLICGLFVLLFFTAFVFLAFYLIVLCINGRVDIIFISDFVLERFIEEKTEEQHALEGPS